MAGTQISVESVKATSGKIGQENATISQTANKLAAGIESIADFWKGQAATKYAAASTDIHQNLKNVVNAANEIDRLVSKTADAYAAADQL